MVSVIINCFNGERYLWETLASVCNQTYKDYEIIFWDNCSDDKTPEIAKKFPVRYFRGNSFVPLGQARNLALSKCRGDYIAFMDSDDLWRCDKLEKQVKIFETHSDVGIVLSGFEILNMLKGTKQVALKRSDMVYEFEKFVCNYINFALSTFIIKKDILNKLNVMFDDKLKYTEEYDFFMRACYYTKAYYINDCLATWRYHGGNWTVKLKDELPNEYLINLDNLRAMIDNLDEKYPSVAQRQIFLYHYTKTKSLLSFGKNKDARRLIRPHIFKDLRSFVFWVLTYVPAPISMKIYEKFYSNRS